jgi:hypothetical protein
MGASSTRLAATDESTQDALGFLLPQPRSEHHDRRHRPVKIAKLVRAGIEASIRSHAAPCCWSAAEWGIVGGSPLADRSAHFKVSSPPTAAYPTTVASGKLPKMASAVSRDEFPSIGIL